MQESVFLQIVTMSRKLSSLVGRSDSAMSGLPDSIRPLSDHLQCSRYLSKGLMTPPKSGVSPDAGVP